MISAPFTFDSAGHVYRDHRGDVVPHITGLLQASGWVDDTWFTEESSVRGQRVHHLTAEYDLGVIEDAQLATVDSHYGNYLRAHAACMKVLKPTWDFVEVPCVHPTRLFAGRPDRVGRVFGRACVFEIKSAVPAKSHPVQTALQAILVAPTLHLPPEQIKRYVEYVDRTGRYKLDEHVDPRDLREAERILRVYA